VAAAIVNCVNFIWFARNQSRFNDKKIHWKSLINLIIAAVSLSGNNSCLKAKSNISEFVLLQKFKVKMNYGNAPKIKEVIWQPPILNWINCNCDDASLGNPGLSACGGLFRDANSSFLGAFAFNIGISNSLNAELIGAMIAIETAASKGWSYLWLESDSMLVVLAFSSAKIVPWALRNRWENCLTLLSNMNFYVSHIYREGNHCADKLANIGLSLNGLTWWNHIPLELQGDFVRNRLVVCHIIDFLSALLFIEGQVLCPHPHFFCIFFFLSIYFEDLLLASLFCFFFLK
jgi:ribonuclease HI